MSDPSEAAACIPEPVDSSGFNKNVIIPYGVTTEHIYEAMQEFVNFLGFINSQLHTRDIARFETLLMPANFSSMVGEFVTASLPKYCNTIAKNQYHNGHPDLMPAGKYSKDSMQYASEGIEIKSSRYLKSWQGHNPEDTWLMVFAFDGNRPVDSAKGIPPKPFKFVTVLGALLMKSDWLFAGRSETSRRTITATVTKSGYDKMLSNWIYKRPQPT